MSAPQKISDVLDPKFGLDMIADNAELEAWLQFLPPAMLEVNQKVAQFKRASEEFEDDLELTKTKELELLDDGMNVTTKKMVLEAKPAMIKARKDARDAKYELRMAEAMSKFIEERSGSIRKIATLRANTQQYQEEMDYTVKARNRVMNNNRGMNQPPPNMGENQFPQQQYQQQQQPFIPQTQQPFQSPNNGGGFYTPPQNTAPNSFFTPQQ